MQETLTLSNHTQRQQGPMSKLLPGVRLIDVEILICPACSHKQALPEHGVRGGCERCDLRWTVFGNSLKIWRAATVPKPPGKNDGTET